MNLLDRITERRPVVDHDGRSGAPIERGVLDGVTPVYIKTTTVEDDLGHLLTGDARRELRLWQTGTLDSLPDGVGTAIVAIEDLGDRLVTVTRDLGRCILRWDRTLTRNEVRRVLAAITSVHRNHLGSPLDGLCPLEHRLALFAPARVNAASRANPDLARAISRGHELFAELAPPEVVEAVHRIYADPQPLAHAMATAGTTLLHGDFFFVNVALEPAEVTPIDWGLATAGPAPLDLVTFCLSAMSNVQLTRSDLLHEARTACRDLIDDNTFSLFELWALAEMGWNKALDAIDHHDPTKRATEQDDLDFWISWAPHTLDNGLLTSRP